jgi:hypothetical protein
MMFSHSLVVGLLAIGCWAMERPKQQVCQNSEIRVLGASQPGLAPQMPDGGRGCQCESASAWLRLRRWLAWNQWNLLTGLACGWALASELSSG